jgi:hypothetical protein
VVFGRFCAIADEIERDAQRESKRRERLCMAVVVIKDTKLVFIPPDATKNLWNLLTMCLYRSTWTPLELT